MEEYKPNSHKSKEVQNAPAEKRVEAVVNGTATTKKKNGLSKFSDVFISEDIKNVKSYVFMDVLVPAIKKAISDVVTNGIDMILYGGRGRANKGPTGKISYRSYYDEPKAYAKPVAAGRFDFDDILYDSRGEAEAVLDQLCDALDRYRMVSVADWYDASGLTAPHTANKYGWMNLSNAEVVRLMGGKYTIKMPRAVPLD